MKYSKNDKLKYFDRINNIRTLVEVRFFFSFWGNKERDLFIEIVMGFFSSSIGSLGRPHRKDNFQQIQWLKDRF